MSETVIRIRRTPGGLDTNNDPIPSTVERTPLQTKGVTPGASRRNTALARNGETIEHTVYFSPAPDLTDDDQLEIRGRVCDIRILDWQSAFGTGRRALEVLASISRG
ncbi:hypothetical protein [Rhodococcus spongiicola]|uniref:Head-tail adaptor protein n=1 Tax=Rhodococcus spongiicola TaxID=2487352 RepID=A0A438B5M1_9NOCA|nr:hypothetical protein [Rhodococcus spongiicola]RVW06228.1 hypothetical protein EF834_01880 [Rhodococcus spongiicola]